MSGSWAEYGIYRQNGYVVYLCADCLEARRACDDDGEFDDDPVHRLGPTVPLHQCQDCEDRVREGEPPIWP